jgi:hypothetical protein
MTKKSSQEGYHDINEGLLPLVIGGLLLAGGAAWAHNQAEESGSKYDKEHPRAHQIDVSHPAILSRSVLNDRVHLPDRLEVLHSSEKLHKV